MACACMCACVLTSCGGTTFKEPYKGVHLYRAAGYAGIDLEITYWKTIDASGLMLDVKGYGRVYVSNTNYMLIPDVDHCPICDEAKEAVKYLILRPDCHLYTKWDDKASLVF